MAEESLNSPAVVFESVQMLVFSHSGRIAHVSGPSRRPNALQAVIAVMSGIIGTQSFFCGASFR